MQLGDNLKAGVIGLGVGLRHAELYADHPNISLAGVCDSASEQLSNVADKIEGTKVYSSADEIIDDEQIDIISICSFDNFHAQQVVRCIERKKHVFVEKPICLNREELIAIVQASRKNPQVKLGSNLILRKTPHFAELLNCSKTGDLGHIYSLDGDYNYGRAWKLQNGWRGKIPFYSVMHGGGIHLLDLFCKIKDYKVRRVTGFGRNCIFPQRPDLHDFALAILEFEDGSLGKVTSNYSSVTPHHHRVSVCGSKKSFESSYGFARIFEGRDDADRNLDKVVDSNEKINKSNLLRDFINNVLTGTGPTIEASEVFKVMAVSIAVEESISSGRPAMVNFEEYQI